MLSYTDKINSRQNSKFKFLKSLFENRKRKKSDLFIVEGLKEVFFAFEAGYIARYIYYSELFFETNDYNISHFIDSKVVCTFIDSSLLKTFLYREGTEAIIAVFETKSFDIEDIKLTENPLVIILESIEKPGNLGAILRTADAVKADLVILCESAVDVYNPNVIRSSVGCFFSQQVVSMTNAECLTWLKNNGFVIYAMALLGSSVHYNIDYCINTAFVFGAEAKGLSDFWLKNSDEKVKIPMLGINDSLNISVSVAVVAYERLRKFYNI